MSIEPHPRLSDFSDDHPDTEEWDGGIGCPECGLALFPDDAEDEMPAFLAEHFDHAADGRLGILARSPDGATTYLEGWVSRPQ